MGFDDQHACNTGLVLGLGLTASQDSSSPTPQKTHHHHHHHHHPLMMKKPNSFEPSLTLGLFGNSFHHEDDDNQGRNNHSLDLYRQGSPHNSHSAVSNSFSSGRVVKRERDMSSEEAEVEKQQVCNSRVISDEDEDGPNARKKLRLTKEQSALLEESFKQHSTLNPKQKQALARQLSLRPRQVEVWFQNRRARTKLKQTEVDCEFLKKCCETLTDENRRLQKEVQELKALKLSQQQPLFMHMPAATLTMCPSCERIGGSEGANSNKSPFSIAHPKAHFYNPFTNSSAAC